MKNTNPQVDAYIRRAAPFARPILERLRKFFHQASPDIEEKIKWGCPSFEHRGLVGGSAAFKQHATFGFWRQDALPDPKRLFKSKGPMGSRLTDASQLPSDTVLLEYIRRAVELNEKGAPRVKAKAKPPVKVPDYFLAALRKEKSALASFQALPPSHKRDYVEWIVEAKKDETRERRLATAVEWIAKGKPRNWKYE